MARKGKKISESGTTGRERRWSVGGVLSYKGKVWRWPPCSNASWLLSSPFASPQTFLCTHCARHSFIHLFMQPTPPPHHHIIAWPGLAWPGLAFALPCLALPCPFLIRTLLPLAVLQTMKKTLILMSTSSSSSSNFFLFLSRIESILLWSLCCYCCCILLVTSLNQ